MPKENLAILKESDIGVVDELEPGTQLMNGQYTITRFLNNGGFGITYLAKDSLDRDIVIKECFPNAFCRRSKTMVAARSRAHQGELRSVVRLFVQEARNLSKLVHPNIVGVHQVFEDNDTAYMAIDYINGRDLLQIIEDQSVNLHPDHIVQIAKKMVAALGFIHDHSMLHRDISPDNILLDEEGEPILIDFGAAREQASKKSRALTALRVVKDGYSPQEFYIAGSEQGPWSDLYALGATLYHIITGTAPVNGQSRLAALAEGRPDPYEALAGRVPAYPEGFLEAIDKAMCALPRKRVQSAAEWLEMLKNPKPKPDAVDGPPEDVVAKLIANADPGAQEDDAPEAERAPVAEAPRKEETKRISHRFAELTVPLDDEYDDEYDEKYGGEYDATFPIEAQGEIQREAEAEARTKTEAQTKAQAFARAVQTKRAMSPLASQQDLEPAQPRKPRSALKSLTVLSSVIAAGLAAFVYLGTPEGQGFLSSLNTAQSDAANARSQTGPTVLGVVPAAAKSDESVAEDMSTPKLATTIGTRVTASPMPKAMPAAVVVLPKLSAAAASAPAPAPAVPETANVLANQIGFAVWDVQLPFEEDTRMYGEVPVAVITRVLSETDAGAWLRRGTTIYAVNGAALTQGGSSSSAVLKNLTVDPDGVTRALLQYKEVGSGKFGEGLITATAIRRVGLVNGTQFEIKVVDDRWQTKVVSVEEPIAGGLRPGDVLFRGKSNDMLVNKPGTLETIIAVATKDRLAEVGFSLLRNNALSAAVMPLARAK